MPAVAYPSEDVERLERRADLAAVDDEPVVGQERGDGESVERPHQQLAESLLDEDDLAGPAEEIDIVVLAEHAAGSIHVDEIGMDQRRKVLGRSANERVGLGDQDGAYPVGGRHASPLTSVPSPHG